VDPLASSKGFWAEVLGVGDFYYELGIVIVQVALMWKGLIVKKFDSHKWLCLGRSACKPGS
jgi:hypothetical protein